MERMILLILLTLPRCAPPVTVYMPRSVVHEVAHKDTLDQTDNNEDFFSPRNQDPSLGVLVNEGNCWLDIEVYRQEGSISRLIYKLKINPNWMGEVTEERRGKLIRVNELWLKIEPGHYRLVVYPYQEVTGGEEEKNLPHLKERKLPLRTYTLRIDSNPIDYIYQDKYVGWVKKIRINAR